MASRSNTIMIGQLAVTIGREENPQTLGSSSGFGASNGQAGKPKESATDHHQVPPSAALVHSYASDDEETQDEHQPMTNTLHDHDQNQEYVNQDNAEMSNPAKRKRYHRHTPYQIQEMEAFFKECPHPDDRQRKELGRALALEPLQVKFWFQNKRTQLKAQGERMENGQLKEMNDRLRTENISFREALAKGACPACSGQKFVEHSPIDANELRMENVRMREEIDRLTALAAQFVGNTFANPNYNLPNPPVIVDDATVDQEPADFGAFGGQGQPEIEGDLLFEEEMIMSLGVPPLTTDRKRMIELANSAMDELKQLAQAEFPLWVRSIDQRNSLLNEDVYYDMFPRAADHVITPPSFKVEATKQSEIIMIDHMSLIEVLVDMEKFVALFAGIVSKGMIVEVISPSSPGNHDNSLQVLTAEFQVLTPTVPTRESVFVRHCRKLAEDTWGVVDVSIDNLYRTGSVPNCHRRPSGCIIQAIPNSGSRVTWIEHVEVEDRGLHYLGKPFFDSRLAFGAQRWLIVLARQCERLASVVSMNLPLDDINNTVVRDPKTRRDILRLSERMVISFYGGVTSSTAYSWLKQTGNGGDEIRIMTKELPNEPGKLAGTVVSATTSFWLPVPQKLVFEFLRDENTRKEWDVLARTGEIREFVHIANGHEVGNCVSMFRVTGTNTSPDLVILQECSTDPTASCVIYAAMDPEATKALFASGIVPDSSLLLPSGFTIYPSERPLPPTTLTNPAPIVVGSRAGVGILGSLVTVAFQVLVDPAQSASIFSFGSVAVINNLIECTMERIKSAVS